MGQQLSNVIKRAVEREDAPFLLAGIADRDGVLWEDQAGLATKDRDVTPDTVLRLFSLTKPIGCFAVMIAIDRGLMTLDTPVEDFAPEFADIQVMEGMGPDGPILHPQTTKVTLRHLLTHTSGLAHASSNDMQSAYNKATGSPDVFGTTIETMKYPLVFEPGERWEYGINIDWACLMVQRADGRPIDQFIREEIFEPVGMKDTTFELDGFRNRLSDVWLRDEDGKFKDFGELETPSHPDIYRLGHCLFSTAPDYLRFLQMILNNCEAGGRQLLSPETARLMFENQIGDLRVPITYPNNALERPYTFAVGIEKSWTTTFMRSEEDEPGKRAAGSLSWAGYTNTHAWIDPANNVAAVLMTQALPFCSDRIMAVYDNFERTLYKELEDIRA